MIALNMIKNTCVFTNQKAKWPGRNTICFSEYHIHTNMSVYKHEGKTMKC
jgi:hypothetical protein